MRASAPFSAHGFAQIHEYRRRHHHRHYRDRNNERQRTVVAARRNEGGLSALFGSAFRRECARRKRTTASGRASSSSSHITATRGVQTHTHIPGRGPPLTTLLGARARGDTSRMPCPAKAASSAVSTYLPTPCAVGRAAEGRGRALRESNEPRRQLVVRR